MTDNAATNAEHIGVGQPFVDSHCNKKRLIFYMVSFNLLRRLRLMLNA
jgi:hypothetical protein